MRKGINLGSKNGMWKGDSVGLDSLHEWVKNRFPKPTLCSDCLVDPPKDLANISQEYKRDLTDWEWLCRRCHMVKDGRLLKLRSTDHTKTGPQSNNTSGYKGVRRKQNAWAAEIQIKGKRKFLGYFKTAKEAAKAYNKAVGGNGYKNPV